MASRFAHLWDLDPSVLFLNHGSFGACPREVLEEQSRLRARMEAEPVRFFVRELPGLLDAARRELAAFLGARPESLAFVANATTGVNIALRALRLTAGDEVLVTDHEYGACRNALEEVVAAAGARVLLAQVPFPASSPDQVVAALLDRLTPRTSAALLDHVTSPTGLVLPVETLVARLEARGVRTVVDGAHAPGMVPLALDRLGCSFYTGNCHKWLCAPKGAGFLWVREDRLPAVRPLVISHGATSRDQTRSRFWLELDWTGTFDPTAWLCVPAALRLLGEQLPGGWAELLAANHRLALEARELVGGALGVEPPCPDDMVGSLAALPLPVIGADDPGPRERPDPLQDALLDRFGIEVPVIRWPAWPRRLLRISAQLYNSREQYQVLAEALAWLLREQ